MRDGLAAKCCLTALAALCVGALDAQTAGADRSAWLERWLFNATERTERAVESLEAGDSGGALEPLETALRLAPARPVARYNAGAARLAASRGDAESLLESVAENGPEALAPLVHYNLGNARLAADDFEGAIAAYQQSLRLDPALEDAKFNLELASRRLQEQPQPEPQDQQDEDQQEQEQDRDRQEQSQDRQQRDPSQEPESQPPEEPERPQESPLPRFRDLPDMTAEEAAAILEAVENLERQARRQEALEAARKHGGGKKDW